MEYLKCDATGCDHREHVGTITADMIGKPCPKCGASLLTKEDFETFQHLGDVLRVFQEIGLMKPHSLDDPIPEGASVVDINIHNNNITIERKEAS